MSEGKKIMYVGLQETRSFDRVNNRPDRFWDGPGAIVDGVPPLQAAGLLGHPDEWRDVTHLNDKELLKAQQAAKAKSAETVRKLRNPPNAPNNAVSVEAATDEQLEAELKRRRAESGAIAADPKKPAPKGPEIVKPRGAAELAEAGGKAMERIMVKVQKNPDLAKTLLDAEGLPTRETLQEELGFPISEDDFKTALGL